MFRRIFAYDIYFITNAIQFPTEQTGKLSALSIETDPEKFRPIYLIPFYATRV